jgi:fucose permease
MCHTLAGLYIAIALVGFGNSNIFSMIFSKALLYMPEKNNEMSGLMIMGLIGGTIFPLLMGILSDAMGTQIGSVIVINLGVAYLIYLAYVLMKKERV